MELTKQTAVITGAGRGIGRALALALVQAGARVVITARSKNQISETVYFAVGNRSFWIRFKLIQKLKKERNR